MSRFTDRRHAGRVLAAKLRDEFGGRGDVLVLALPRGGVPVAIEVARALRAPLDVCVVRKLGAPGHEELAIGAIATGGVRILNNRLIQELGITPEVIPGIEQREREELVRRERLYRNGRRVEPIEGRVVIVVDDGLATGASMLAAVEAVHAKGAARIIAAAPVGARETCRAVSHVADACVCAAVPEPFMGVGEWYDNFLQLSDAEVLALLIEGELIGSGK